MCLTSFPHYRSRNVQAALEASGNTPKIHRRFLRPEGCDIFARYYQTNVEMESLKDTSTCPDKAVLWAESRRTPPRTTTLVVVTSVTAATKSWLHANQSHIKTKFEWMKILRKSTSPSDMRALKHDKHVSPQLPLHFYPTSLNQSLMTYQWKHFETWKSLVAMMTVIHTVSLVLRRDSIYPIVKPRTTVR